MIWRKQNENMDPSCLVTTVKAAGGGCNGVGDVFLVPIGHRLNATMATSNMIIHHVTKLESFQIGFLNITMSSM